MTKISVKGPSIKYVDIRGESRRDIRQMSRVVNKFEAGVKNSRAIHKLAKQDFAFKIALICLCKGTSINYVDKILRIFDSTAPFVVKLIELSCFFIYLAYSNFSAKSCLSSLSLTFGRPCPSPCLST